MWFGLGQSLVLNLLCLNGRSREKSRVGTHLLVADMACNFEFSRFQTAIRPSFAALLSFYLTSVSHYYIVVRISIENVTSG